MLVLFYSEYCYFESVDAFILSAGHISWPGFVLACSLFIHAITQRNVDFYRNSAGVGVLQTGSLCSKVCGAGFQLRGEGRGSVGDGRPDLERGPMPRHLPIQLQHFHGNNRFVSFASCGKLILCRTNPRVEDRLALSSHVWKLVCKCKSHEILWSCVFEACLSAQCLPII